MEENPYQPPKVTDVAAPHLSEAEEVRRFHLKHEASLKGMGSLFFLGGVVLALALLPALAAVFSGWSSGAQGPEILVMLLMMAVCVAQFFAWSGLRKLRPWVTIPAAILSILGLLFGLFTAGLGAILGVYFLYLLFSAKGRRILSPGYAEIVAQTPAMKYRTPLWIWILLAIIVILLIVGMFFVTES